MSLTPDQNSAITPPPVDLNRRTILQGAAWTIPAIAVATVAPAASASTAAVLAFNQASYSGTACSTITGAYVTVTVGGVPTAGRSVTTTLSGGYTFAGGSTTNTQISDGSGRVNLPEISVPSVGGSGAASAMTTGSPVTSSTLSAPDVWSAKSLDQVNYRWTFPGIPSTAVPLPGAYVLFLDGDKIINMNGPTTIATGVTNVVSWATNTGGWVVKYTENGVAKSLDNTGYQWTFSGIPSTAVPLPGAYVLFLDGDKIINMNGPTTIATGVTNVVSWATNSGGWVVKYTENGVAKSLDSTGYQWTFTGIPSTAVPLPGAYSYFLNGTDIITSSGVFASAVTNVVSWPISNGGWIIKYTENGVAKSFDQNSWHWTFTGIPSTAVPLPGPYFHFLDGTDLIDGNGVVASNVTNVVSWPTNTGGWIIKYTQVPSC
jgi:hypothetical protein